MVFIFSFIYCCPNLTLVLLKLVKSYCYSLVFWMGHGFSTPFCAFKFLVRCDTITLSSVTGLWLLYWLGCGFGTPFLSILYPLVTFRSTCYFTYCSSVWGVLQSSLSERHEIYNILLVRLHTFISLLLICCGSNTYRSTRLLPSILMD